MRAVNLMPPESRRGGRDARALRGPGAAVVGLLGVALMLVTLYVLASNSVTDRQAQLAGVKQQLAQTQALTARLNSYTQFAALARTRVQTVRDIAASRFNWQSALSDLSRVVPANTSLDSLSATVAPGSGAAGGSGSSGGLRTDIPAPAFELQGCTASQDDVARLISRLRLIRGVTRVTLADSVKSASSTAGTTVSSASGVGGCSSNAPSFDLVVFFTPPPVLAAPPTSAPGSSTPAAGATPSTTTPPTSTTGSTQ